MSIIIFSLLFVNFIPDFESVVKIVELKHCQ
jgi:hypothetical protein